MAFQEGVRLQTRASLWRKMEDVGGGLTLTEHRLSFRAHALNVQTAPLDIPLSEIIAIRKYRTLGIFPNGLAVTATSGTEYRFKTSKRDRYIGLIHGRELDRA